MAGQGASPFTSSWLGNAHRAKSRGASLLLGRVSFGDADAAEGTVWNSWLFGEQPTSEPGPITSVEVTWPGTRTKKRRQITLGEVIAMEQREQRSSAKQAQTEPKTERHEAAEPEAPAPDDGLIKSLIAMPPSEIQVAPLTKKQINSRLRQQEEEEMALLLVLAN